MCFILSEVFFFAVILLECKSKPLFSCSIPGERIKLNFKSSCRRKSGCLFLLADAEVGARKKTFTEVQTERLEQADRSVLIKCPSKLNEKKLLQYLSSHGKIDNYFFFENRVSS